MKLILDERIRKVEKEALEDLGYNVILLKKDNRVYEEISSHSDIFLCKVGNKLIVEKERYPEIKSFVDNKTDTVCGEKIGNNYPEDVKYNVCIVRNTAIHNFDFTDPIIKQELIKNDYRLISVKQGYTNCSIAVIDEKHLITCDRGIYDTLKKYDFEILFLEEKLDIKLSKNGKYSEKNGFIGGCISRIGNKIIVFGDLNKIDKNQKIREFIEERKLKIVDFNGLDVVDYGGVVEI